MISKIEKYAAQIDRVVSEALEMASNGNRTEAVRAFALCRTLLETRASENELTRRINAEQTKLRAEADRMRDHFLSNSKESAKRRITIISDSLGLPRPQEAGEYVTSIGLTYSGQIFEQLSDQDDDGVYLDTFCQRYFTTDEAIALIRERSRSLDAADVLVHLGLNDCSIRMLMVPQRIAVGLLPAATREKVLEFARVYRADLVRAYPSHQYVPVERFEANLFEIAQLAKNGGARSLTFSTITLVPMRFWPSTPGVVRNFATYNLTILKIAEQVGANVLEVDRLMWQHGTGTMLDNDGMHLSHKGHNMLAALFLRTVTGA